MSENYEVNHMKHVIAIFNCELQNIFNQEIE